MGSRQLLAFKRAPTVELRLDDLSVEVRDDRVVLAIEGDTVWFSWNEWHDFTRRVAPSIQWIEEHTPEDVTGVSFKAEDNE